MIREISSEQIEDIRPIFDRLREKMGDIPENFFDQIKDSVSADKTSLYADYDEGGSVRGVGLFGKVSSRFSMIFADGDLELEKEIASVLFERFSKERDYIVTGGPWLSKSLIDHLISLGFMKHDRAYMTLARENVEAIPDSDLPDGMKFETYVEPNRQEVSQLVFSCNDGHVDQDVFPEFFGTPEACNRLLENIETNRYGEYKDGQSWLLISDGSNIGACFMTIRQGKAGYIPDICIEPEFRGKGLGKTLLLHSMKRQLEAESDLTQVDLDVTLSNNALYLYKSLGFDTVREYSMYTWKQAGQ
jgi:GNAT superfamily N-acetyltransferase